MFRPENAQSLAGLGFVIAVCWALSETTKAFPWRLALGAVAVQIGTATFADPRAATKVLAGLRSPGAQGHRGQTRETR